MTAQEALSLAIRQLATAGIEGATRDARILLAFALGVPKDRVTLCLQEVVSDRALDRLEKAVTQRIARVPVSRIIGFRDFWGRRFEVTDDVLDPRPETETLIAAALEGCPATHLLDLGTGSGILAISLLAEWPVATGIATDLSACALAVAARNAENLGVADRLEMLHSDWFESLSGQFDLIVSNPPYIAASEMPGLSSEVRNHDPGMALSDGADGLTAYRAITAGAGGNLLRGGRLMVEIGWTQGRNVSEMFRAAGFTDVRILPDLDGRDRVVQGVWLG